MYLCVLHPLGVRNVINETRRHKGTKIKTKIYKNLTKIFEIKKVFSSYWNRFVFSKTLHILHNILIVCVLR